jgi:hypothetical protein
VKKNGERHVVEEKLLLLLHLPEVSLPLLLLLLLPLDQLGVL